MSITLWPSGYVRGDYAPNKALHTSKVANLLVRDEANTYAPFHVEISGSHQFAIAVLLDSPTIYIPSYGLNRVLHLQADFWTTSTSGQATVYLTDFTDITISGTHFNVSGNQRQRIEMTLPIADGWRDDTNQFRVYGIVSGILGGDINVATSGAAMNCWLEEA